MIILHERTYKRRPVENQIKKKIKFAWLPVFMRYTDSHSAYPDYELGNLIWWEKYVNTYRYNSTRKAWVLIKSEQLTEEFIDKLSD